MHLALGIAKLMSGLSNIFLNVCTEENFNCCMFDEED